MQKTHKKINIEFVDEKFECDNEKKTVKCTLIYKPNIKEFAENYGRPSDKIMSAYPKMCRGLKEAFDKNLFVTTGVAKCAENDVFDFEVGKEIARFRARSRAEKKYNNLIFSYFRLMMDTADKIDKALAQSDMAIEINKRFAKELMKD